MPLNPIVQRALQQVAPQEQAPQDGLERAKAQVLAKRMAASAPQQLGGVAAGSAVGANMGQYIGSQGGVNIDRILATIRKLESGGNYTARNPVSSASGAYQFIDGTWGRYGGYTQAWQAPQQVQDAKAREHIQSILSKYGNVLESVPAAWYTGTYKGKGKLNYHPGGPGNPLSVQQYVNKWLQAYGS